MSESETRTELEEVKLEAKELARVLAETPEFQAFEKAQLALRRDSGAQQVILQFQQKQRELQMFGFFGDVEGRQRELEILRQRMLDDPTVKEYVKAQEELLTLLQETNQIITQIAGLDFAAACAQAGGCC